MFCVLLMPKIYARIKSKGSFDIYSKFLIFWRRPHEDLIIPRGARAKNVKKKKSPPTGRNCENTAISFAIRAKWLKQNIFFLNCLPMLRNDREIRVRTECSLLRPPSKIQFSPFSTLSRQNSNFHQKSKSARNNFLPNYVFFYFQISIVKYF